MLKSVYFLIVFALYANAGLQAGQVIRWGNAKLELHTIKTCTLSAPAGGNEHEWPRRRLLMHLDDDTKWSVSWHEYNMDWAQNISPGQLVATYHGKDNQLPPDPVIFFSNNQDDNHLLLFLRKENDHLVYWKYIPFLEDNVENYFYSF